jgi:hypothetical protein
MSCEGENETRKQDKGFKDEIFIKKKNSMTGQKKMATVGSRQRPLLSELKCIAQLSESIEGQGCIRTQPAASIAIYLQTRVSKHSLFFESKLSKGAGHSELKSDCQVCKNSLQPINMIGKHMTLLKDMAHSVVL